MRQEVQWYLAEALAYARGMKGVSRRENQSERILASFSGGLAALRYVGEVTADEENDWRERMRVALGITANRIVVRVAGQDEPPLSVTPAPVRRVRYPRFVRSIPGLDTEYELYGGRAADSRRRGL